MDLQLDYVYGYRSKDCRNNVKYLKSGSIVYNAAALGVTLDPSQNIQRFYNKHSDDVLCIDVHPDGIVYFIINLIACCDRSNRSKARYPHMGFKYITNSLYIPRSTH